MVFIDGNNLYHAWRTHYGVGTPDIRRFIDRAVQKKPGRVLKRAYYYIAELSSDDDPERARGQERFLVALNYIPKLTTVLGRLEKRTLRFGQGGYTLTCNRCGGLVEGEIQTRTEKGTDINLAIDMLLHAVQRNFDVALLVSADGDLARLAEEIKRLGAQVEVVLLEGQPASALIAACDDQIVFTREDCAASRMEPGGRSQDWTATQTALPT